MKFLVADDSPVMRRLLQVTLAGWGYEVVLAEDGAQAWECLQAEDAPPMAILDWIMPEFTGPEVCSMLRSRRGGRYTYVLLLTSKNQREDIVEGMGAGADDYIVKPFDKHEMEVRIRAGRRIVDLQVELMKVQEQLREQATRDALTGCWNRASILEILERELHRSRREQRPLGVAMIDLDHFKEINDTGGHAAGDHVLRRVVDCMTNSMRNYDAVGRYGGEEFLLVLPGCDEKNLRRQAERMRNALQELESVWEGERLTVTASFGLSHADPGATLSPMDLITAADEALYEAKRTGRNRVVYASACEAPQGV
jgi:diguanylate cyclase (GGDEF)-like protein